MDNKYKISRYKYSIQLNHVNGSEVTNIKPELISSLLIDYNYKNAMPSIYIILNIDSDNFTKLVTTTASARLSLYIKRYNQDSSTSASKDIVKDLFIYFFPSSDVNYTKELDFQQSDDIPSNAYKRITIGLVSAKLIDQNRCFFNNLYKDINIATLIQLGIKQIPKIIIEQFANNDKISQIFIPPIDTVSNYIKYINTCASLYKNGDYIFFMDFDKSYLVSTNGIGIDSSDGTYTNINIDIRSTTSENANSMGIVEDDENRTYILFIDALDTSVTVDRGNDKIVNHLIGIDTKGNIQEQDIDTIDDKTTIKKRVMRIPNENSNYFKKLIKEVRADIVISLSKTEIDSSIFTPNKIFTISNFAENNKYNGIYYMTYKKDMLIQQDGDFMGLILLGLDKV